MRAHEDRQAGLLCITEIRYTAKMEIPEIRHTLRCIGWRPISQKRQADGRFRLSATNCGHTVIGIADSRKEAWLLACRTALKVARNGWTNGRP